MGLGVVLNEIDEIAKATLGSITLATMLRMIERQQHAGAGGGRASEPDRSRGRRREVRAEGSV
jgi:hypothetical protein